MKSRRLKWPTNVSNVAAKRSYTVVFGHTTRLAMTNLLVCCVLIAAIGRCVQRLLQERVECLTVSRGYIYIPPYVSHARVK